MPDTQNPPVSPVRTLALDDLPSGFGPSAVAVGNFDGVHRGHAALIQTAIAEARRQDARAIVLTFEPHPRTFFRPERPVFRMTPPAAKARIMAALGIDAMVAARYDWAGTLRGGEGPTAFSVNLSGWTLMTGLTHMY